jgi:hypothetical protein
MVASTKFALRAIHSNFFVLLFVGFLFFAIRTYLHARTVNASSAPNINGVLQVFFSLVSLLHFLTAQIVWLLTHLAGG